MAIPAPRDGVDQNGSLSDRHHEQIPAEITAARDDATAQCRALVSHMTAIGRLLAEAKRTIDPSGWPGWVENNAGMTMRLAGRYIDLAGEASNPTNDIVSRILCGALDIRIEDEIVLPPDIHHLVKGEDVDGRILYLWRTPNTPDLMHVVGIFGSSREYICTAAPIRVDQARLIMARRSPIDFTIANASYAVLPIDDVARDALEDMRRRYVAKGEAEQ